MRRLLVLFMSCALAAAIDKDLVQQIKARVTSDLRACGKSAGAPDDEVARILGRELASTHAGKCIYFCMHKKYHAQNADGSLNLAGALAHLDLIKDIDPELHEKVATTFRNCANTPVNPDPCEFAASLVECLVIESKAQGLEESILD